jgi:hypothetical protein
MNTKLTFKQVLVAGSTAAVVSAVINAILFFVFHTMGWISDDIFVQPNQPMTIGPVIISSILPSLIGSLVFFLLEKYTQNGFRIFSIISILLMVVSFAMPFTGIPNVTTQYALSLEPMHLVVPLSLLYFIHRSKKSKS